MERYVVLNKRVGETPLQCAEAWRERQFPFYKNIPLAYAGRLDPMASGRLLILIGDECKNQQAYHNLDKTYEFEVLFGVLSDTGDVLGLTDTCYAPDISTGDIKTVLKKIHGTVLLPYPHFSSKTVNGKPLHTWTLEGRIHEIEIPKKYSSIYSLKLLRTRTISKATLYKHVTEKIETIRPVTDPGKVLGNDFRRPDVRASWKAFNDAPGTPSTFMVAKFRATVSSGTYMRTLAEVIATELGTCGLAYSIHRTKIGRYQPLPLGLGFWKKRYRRRIFQNEKIFKSPMPN